MSRTTMTEADKLHQLVGRQLTAILESGGIATAECKCGETVTVPIPAIAKYYDAALKFLRDNGIDSIPAEGGITKKLAANLPFPVVEPHEQAQPGESGQRARVLPFPSRG